MMNLISHTWLMPASLFRYLLGLAVIPLALAVSIGAQTTTTHNPTDGYTPSGLKPGSPAGSYALSGFDNINPYSGALNFRLPLMQIGGRGNAAYTMQLPIEQKWTVTYSETVDPERGQTWYSWQPSFNYWSGIRPGYGPGILEGRASGSPNTTTCWFQPNVFNYSFSLTRLTFITPDGTEYELIDTLYQGKPLPVDACAYEGTSRGANFVTTDGTTAAFISDDPIRDEVRNTGDIFYPSGMLMLRDGTRYRIDGGLVSYIQDRQGNKITFVNGSNARVTNITDSLGRSIDIVYDVNDGAPYGLCDRITYNGFGNVPRTLRVSKRNLSSVLRADSPLRTYQSLFPEFGAAFSNTNHDPTLVSAVWLPDGRSYKFYYNSYSELARVELPTGGVFEYDWRAGLTNGPEGGSVYALSQSSQIYRRVVQKRIYESGNNLESVMTISRPEGITDPPNSTLTNLGYVIIAQQNAAGTPLSITKHYYWGSSINSMLDGATDPTRYTTWKEGKEYQTEVLDTDGATVLRRVQNQWQQCEQCEIPMTWTHTPYELGDNAPANNPQIVSTTTQLLDGGANQVSKQAFKYDAYNNLTDTWDYDYGAGQAPAYPLRHSHTDYLAYSNGVTYNGIAVHICNLPAGTWVKAVDTTTGVEATNFSAKSELRYDETSYPLIEYGAVTGWSTPNTNALYAKARGNVTTKVNWKDNASYVVTHAQYDQLGNLRKAWDARGQLSQIEYSSAYYYAFPTKTISAPVPDPNSTSDATITFETNSLYDLPSGLLTSITDANGQTTNIEYYDALDRPTRVLSAGGAWTSFEYGDNAGNLFLRVQSAFDASRTLESRQYFDGLGRSVRSYKSEGATWLVADTQYDALSRVWRVSNPYRNTGLGGAINPSDIWTTTQYDALGRARLVTMPDGATVTTTYNGNATTITAPQDKSRRTVTDALGRLTQVIENPGGLNYQTNYSYDVMGNLRKVVQGAQERFFMYDALNRLVRAKMVEQEVNDNLSLTDSVTGHNGWSLGYTYDDNGNVLTRTDARGITTTYAYDALNRNTTVRYSDAPQGGINHFYDGATNGKGMAWKDEMLGADGSLITLDSYDAQGRPMVERQQFKADGVWSPSYTVQQSYGLASQLLSQTYPSGHVTTYLYDDAGRPLSFSGNLGDGVERSYASATSYDTAGRMQEERYGTLTPLYQKLRYNVRGQLYDVRLSTLPRITSETDWNRGCLAFYYSNLNPQWGASASDNNGNVMKSENYVPTSDGSYNMTQDRYDYDPLNRLLSMSEYQNGQGTMVFKQAYAYDQFGNRTINQTTTTNTTGINKLALGIDSASNRLTVPTGLTGAITYDKAGNLITDTYTGTGARTYDEENR
ncbi:MAG: RHS repeat protein, partial [Acidobacteria bacterium]|nr:RHS repeat protein [Acidobacteriota bacterium]